MGGWIVFGPGIGDVEARVRRFRGVFARPEMPGLIIESRGLGGGHALAWAWRLEDTVDVAFRDTPEGGGLILSGRVWGGAGLVPEALDAPGGLDGSFALIGIEPGGMMRAVTDRFASRPIWHYRDREGWILSDVPSAIACVAEREVVLNPAGVWSFFHTMRRVGSEGIYDGIGTLHAGEAAAFDPAGGEPMRRFWFERRYAPDNAIGARGLADILSDALRRAAGRVASEFEFPSLFLSGGMDSRLAAASFGGRARAVTLASAPNAESGIAARVARASHMEGRLIVRDNSWYLARHASASLLGSCNYYSYHAHFMAPVARMEASGMRSAYLLGDMLENLGKHYFRSPGDGGFPKRADDVEPFFDRHIPYTIPIETLLGIFDPSAMDDMRGAYSLALREYARTFEGVSESPEDWMDTLLRWGGVTVTPTFLMMSAIRPLGAERNLALGIAFDEASLRIPAPMRRSGVIQLELLRVMNPALGRIPDANTMLPPSAPAFVKKAARRFRPWLGRLRRAVRGGAPGSRTSGSWPLMHELYRMEPGYRAYVESTLGNVELYPASVFNHKGIGEALDGFMRGDISLMPLIEGLLTFGALQGQVPVGAWRERS